MKVLVIIPAYNEAGSIRKVIRSIRASDLGADIVVINDASKDNTAAEAAEEGVNVITLPINLGIGGAVQTGYKYACVTGYDVAVQVDGDGQHDGKDLCKVVDGVMSGEADIVVGSRFVEESGYKPSVSRGMGILFFSKLVSKIVKMPLTDTTSGFRAINRKGIELFSRYYPGDYPEVETIVYAASRGLKIKEVSVDMQHRQHGKSSISLFNGLYYMVKVTIMLLLIPGKNY
ncbi:MAG: glycosyltransferase family 2 protein [Peptococcaceae bacterium]|nr:glycosyltransferase family 2 protein [Peptococcaceae bacterium]MDR2736940.1 glycosyltransferase family 2 protein [Gracilibacteraceae bacterium]